MERFVALALVLLSCTTENDAVQIGKGSFCIAPTTTHGNPATQGCDNELTNLICYEGKCQCPEALSMSSGNLPSNLNTRWYEPLTKCFATRGSLCDLHPTKKRVDCMPGVTCVPDPKNPVAGTCTGSTLQFVFSTFTILVIFPYYAF